MLSQRLLSGTINLYQLYMLMMNLLRHHVLRDHRPRRAGLLPLAAQKKFEEAGLMKRIGEGRENFSEEKLSLPSPNPIPPFPKTFVFIESLLGRFPCGRKHERRETR